MARLQKHWKGSPRPIKEEEGSFTTCKKMKDPSYTVRTSYNNPLTRGSSMEDLKPRLRPMGRPPLPLLTKRKFTKDDSSSVVVVYRSAKYDGIVGRWKAYLRTSAQLMVLQAMPFMHTCHDYLLQIVGVLYLALFSPIHVFISLVLYFVRKGRFYLVRRTNSEVIICEDLSPRCVFVEKSLGMVTLVLWLRGRTDIHHLRKNLLKKSQDIPALRYRLDDLFGLRVLVQSKNVPFEINNHVMEAPREFLKHFVIGERLYTGKSALEQYVTKCASERLNPDVSPWRITVIPLPIFNKEETCVVLRVHQVLLNFPQVRDSLCGGIFMQSIYEDLDSQNMSLCRHFSSHNGFNNANEAGINVCDGCISFGESIDGGEDILNASTATDCAMELQVSFEQPVDNVKGYIQRICRLLFRWLKKNLYVSSTDFQTWMNLRMKQLQFHSRTAVLKTIFLEILLSLRNSIASLQTFPWIQFWAELKSILFQLFLILRAAAFVPIEIYSLLLCPNPRKSGFRWVDKSGARRIAWTDPISSELVEAIKERTGATMESIVLAACSLALKHYYCETGLENPKTVEVLVPLVTSDLLSPSSYASVEIQTDHVAIPQQLQKISLKLGSTPAWILLGRYFILKYISYVVPRPLAYLVMRRLFRRYPVTFTKVNLQSPSSIFLPHMSLWDKTLDDFFFWKPPYSDFCVSVSLIVYSETMRLSVMSPMKSLDTVLANKFGQHLCTIAEAVGVEKSLIPYSRRSSPASSYCSSPSSSVRSQERLIRGVYRNINVREEKEE